MCNVLIAKLITNTCFRFGTEHVALGVTAVMKICRLLLTFLLFSLRSSKRLGGLCQLSAKKICESCQWN